MFYVVYSRHHVSCLLPRMLSSSVHSVSCALSWWYAVVLTGVSQGVSSLVRARVGGSAELGCNLSPTSREVTTPNLFPLHVVEWVRLGYNVPILIKFGVYAPRVHPNYKGKSYSDAPIYTLSWEKPCFNWILFLVCGFFGFHSVTKRS